MLDQLYRLNKACNDAYNTAFDGFTPQALEGSLEGFRQGVEGTNEWLAARHNHAMECAEFRSAMKARADFIRENRGV